MDKKTEMEGITEIDKKKETKKNRNGRKDRD